MSVYTNCYLNKRYLKVSYCNIKFFIFIGFLQLNGKHHCNGEIVHIYIMPFHGIFREFPNSLADWRHAYKYQTLGDRTEGMTTELGGTREMSEAVGEVL